MCMPSAPVTNRPLLRPSQIADLRLAASKLTGPQRRAFEAEMTVKYCDGNPLLAETVFGWGRQTVSLGLAERRTGIICLGSQSGLSVVANAGKSCIRRPPKRLVNWRRLMRNKIPPFAPA